ncbi:MAG: ECF transporter S component [Clostridia bacterium]|nr:ECF transporter S component [Clostridia bacterium]
MEQEETVKEITEIPETEMKEVTKPKNKIGEAFRNYFTATRMAYLAVFTALAYVLYMPFLEFPIIPAVPFLKVDFSNSFVMIAGFALGPVAGVVVGVLKEILHALTFSQTVGVGELANIMIMLPYILIPSIVYKKRKGIKTVIVSLVIGCVCQVVWSIPTNYLLTFPFFLIAYAGAPDWTTGMNFYLSVWYWAVLFNFVKTVLITAAVLLLYKPLSKLIKITNAKFNSLKAKKNSTKTQ